MTRRVAVLDAPRHLAFEPRSAASEAAAYAARQRALVARLGARDAGWVEAPCCDEAEVQEPPPEGDRRARFKSFTEALAARTRELVSAREFPVVLGGDCSILLGNMLALRRLGRYGLLFVDGVDEFSYAPGRHRNCGYFASAGLDLALATGNGPDALSNLYGLRPYVDERHVVLFGMYRDPDDTAPGGEPPDIPAIPPIQQLRMDRIREVGARAAAAEALRYLETQSLDGFWIHVDADVLDRPVETGDDEDAPEMPGLEFEELGDALEVFLSSERAAGMEMTIYDPELDPDGACGERLVDSVVRAFAPTA